MEDERAARMVEYPRRAFKLPRTIESLSDRFLLFNRQVLHDSKTCQVQHERNIPTEENLILR